MFTRVNAACSVMLGLTLPRVGKVAGSEATTIKRSNAIPLFTYFHRKNARTHKRSTYYTRPPNGRAVYSVDFVQEYFMVGYHIRQQVPYFASGLGNRHTKGSRSNLGKGDY